MNKKRVVSKPAYAEYLAKKLGLNTAATVLVVTGAVGFMVSLIGVMSSLDFMQRSLQCFGSITLGVLAIITIDAGLALSRHAETMPEVIPLTQQTAEQISAEESLVRASSQPTEQPETILLRAAQFSTETPAEELLRSSQPEELLGRE